MRTRIKQILKSVIAFLAVILLLTNNMFAQELPKGYHADSKKLILFQGNHYWDWSVNLAKNLEEMQKTRPFLDGLAFHTGESYGNPPMAFNNEIWTEKTMHFDELAIIKTKWTTLTDNFITVWGHSNNIDPDFFNDTLWNQIIKNTVLLGKAVKISGCKGIMCDPEFYSTKETYSPWWYKVPLRNPEHTGKPPYDDKSFIEVCSKARERGKAYVEALQVHMPNITILTTFLYSYVWAYCYNDLGKLPTSEYGLLAAFADGMVEGLNPGSIIVDGNETAYYVDETRKYFEDSDQNDYLFNKKVAPAVLCDSVINKKYASQGQIAMASYLELCYNKYSFKPWSTPEYQSKWMKHNVYNSLLATDKYVWIWAESMDFWKGTNAPEDVDVFRDIGTAATLFKNGKALGYDMYKPDSIFIWRNDKKAEFVDSPVITLQVSDTKLPGKITFKAKVNSEEPVSKVEFFVNSVKMGEDNSSPFVFSYDFAKDGYLVFARVFLKNGKHTTSAPIVLK